MNKQGTEVVEAGTLKNDKRQNMNREYKKNNQ